jgi:hypothetical protein
LSAPALLREVDEGHSDFGTTEGFLLVYTEREGGWALGEIGRIKRRPSKQGLLTEVRGGPGEEPRNFLSLHFVIRPFGVEQQRCVYGTGYVGIRTVYIALLL